jgi:hypothetical protein
MPEFNRDHGEMDAAGADTTLATARLPGLDIEIVNRRAAEDDAEQISINLRAAPSFEAFGRALEAANPVAIWALAWQPWLVAARAPAQPWRLALSQPGGEGTSRTTRERDSPS